MKLIEKIYSVLMHLRSEVSTSDLKKLGLKVGKGFCRQEKTLIDQSHCWLISIGDDVTLAPRVHILAHDASTKHELGYTRIGLVDIGNNVFVGASSIILPGVVIGDNVVIGANSVVSKDIPSNSVAVGCPARVICTYDEYIEKKRKELSVVPCYQKEYTLNNPKLNDKMKEEMKNALAKGKIGYVE